MSGWRFWRRSRVGPAISAADRARDRQEWGLAATLYADVVRQRPHLSQIWVQLGHVLGELERHDDAVSAYRRALEIDPAVDTFRHLGDMLLRQGARDEAIDVYAAALDHDPKAAARSLLDLGASDRLPEATLQTIRSELQAREAKAKTALAAIEDDLMRYSVTPLGSYDFFRHAHPVGPPPHTAAGPVTILIDARWAIPAFLRSTLQSLINQSRTDWSAWVIAGRDLIDQPVGSFAAIDQRIRFIDPDEWPHLGISQSDGAVIVEAGTLLDVHALAWLTYAATLNARDVVYPDHDHGAERWSETLLYSEPCLFWTHDRYFLAATPEPPALVWISGTLLGVLLKSALRPLSIIRRELIVYAERPLHVPRILATILRLPDLALHGFPDRLPAIEAIPDVPAVGQPGSERILVIIPTRDAGELIDMITASLRSMAAQPLRLDILISDNRSSDPATIDFLADGSVSGRFEIDRFDEPFNWSRMNNLAVADRDHEILVFLNNDMEMLSYGWDDRMREALSDRQIGAVGARLLYPNNTFQHAGILFGASDGFPVHEGLGRQAADPGPARRFATRHLAAAVTGAFLGIRAALFREIGGFDEQLFIAYNDVEFCFRLRAAGYAILYEPAIELTHHESYTRGIGRKQSDISWDNAERAAVYARWGDALCEDPSLNPQWARRGSPLTTLRDPDDAILAKYLAEGSRTKPWKPPLLL